MKAFYSRKIYLVEKKKYYWLPCSFLHIISPFCSPLRSCNSSCSAQRCYEGLNRGEWNGKFCAQRCLRMLSCSILGLALVQVAQKRASPLVPWTRGALFITLPCGSGGCWRAPRSEFICSWQPFLYSLPNAAIRIPCWPCEVAKYPSSCHFPPL